MHKTLRVLLVEDDEDDYVLTRDLLRQVKSRIYEVDWAPNWDAGFDKLKRNQYDVVLVDYHLGARNGLDFVREAAGTGITAPIILLTGARETEVDRIALQAGAADYLAKAEATSPLLDRYIRYALERAEASLRLHRSNEDLQRFAYAVSHDLQEPLRAISTFSELLVRRFRDRLDHDAEDLVDYITEGVHRMSKQISALLAFSRVGGDSACHLQDVDCNVALANALQNLLVQVKETGSTLTADELPLVRADLSRLTQLFQNLIGNAIKYRQIGQAPEIHISVVQKEEEYVISVSDNGVGFDPAQTQRIFDVFTRLHKDEYAGSGVGLAICKRIVEGFGGRIWAESQIGIGSTFHFSLPAAGQRYSPNNNDVSIGELDRQLQRTRSGRGSKEEAHKTKPDGDIVRC